MRRLVFYFGTKETHQDRAFDLIPASSIIGFDSPDAEKYKVLPKTIIDKMESNIDVDLGEETFVNGLYQMLEESKPQMLERDSN